MWLPLRAEISTQFSCFNFSSSTPSCRMGPLMISPSLEGALCLLWWELLSFKLSMRFSRLRVLDLFFSWPFMLKLKLDSSLGEGRLQKESSLLTKLPEEEQTLMTELVRGVAASPLWGTWAGRLLVLLRLRTEATSWCSLRSVSMLSWLGTLFRWGSSGDPGTGSCFGEKTSNSSSRDHLLLSLWKVHLPLIAQGSSSSESSLCRDRIKLCDLGTGKQQEAGHAPRSRGPGAC